jgi:hypothetical protein
MNRAFKLGLALLIAIAKAGEPSPEAVDLNDLLNDGVDPYFVDALREYAGVHGESSVDDAPDLSGESFDVKDTARVPVDHVDDYADDANPSSNDPFGSTTMPTTQILVQTTLSEPTAKPIARPTFPKKEKAEGGGEVEQFDAEDMARVPSYDDDDDTNSHFASRFVENYDDDYDDDANPSSKEPTAKPTAEPTAKPIAKPKTEKMTEKAEGGGDGDAEDCEAALTTHCQKFARYTKSGSTPESCASCVAEHIPLLSDSCVTAIIVGETDFAANFCPPAPTEVPPAPSSFIEHDFGLILLLVIGGLVSRTQA